MAHEQNGAPLAVVEPSCRPCVRRVCCCWFGVHEMVVPQCGRNAIGCFPLHDAPRSRHGATDSRPLPDVVLLPPGKVCVGVSQRKLEIDEHIVRPLHFSICASKNVGHSFACLEIVSEGLPCEREGMN